MLRVFLLIAGLCLFLFPPLASQGVSLPIIINEIAWAGTAASYNNEWIELYNSGDKDINIDGWILKSADKTPEINLSGMIPAKNFYLLERTDDETVPDIKADLIYKGALSNKGEDLTLYNNSGNLIDETNCSSGWFAGNNKTKQTMERISPSLPGNDAENWRDSRNPGGTPKAANSKQKKEKKKMDETRPRLGQDEVGSRPSRLTEIINYPAGVVFSEILPSPKGPDAKNEWIEIQNQNKFEVNLSGWQIKDKTGKTTAYIFPDGAKISSLGYLVLKRPETKITLNNGGDGLELINPNKEIVDSAVFGKAPLNQSYNRMSLKGGWRWSVLLTPGAKNIISVPNPLPDKKSKSGPSPVLPTKKSGNGFLTVKSAAKKETAAMGEKIPKSFNNFFVLLISSIIAISSAITILILKKSTTKRL